MTKDPTLPATQWTDENILDLIRKVRNDLIKDFLDDRVLLDYLKTNFRIADLSRVQQEFIRNDLKELLISPVNTVHYAHLIDQIRETDTASLSGGNEALFYREVEFILRKYLY
jgi:hypothetical protein